MIDGEGSTDGKMFLTSVTMQGDGGGVKDCGTCGVQAGGGLFAQGTCCSHCELATMNFAMTHLCQLNGYAKWLMKVMSAKDAFLLPLFINRACDINRILADSDMHDAVHTAGRPPPAEQRVRKGLGFCTQNRLDR
jgi:hypothetical protein